MGILASMAATQPKPEVSVVVVSDYDSGGEKSWADLRKTLRGLAEQDYEGEAEFLLCESAELAGKIPADLLQILPAQHVISSTCEDSYGLKNDGVKAATADLVAILDADCVPCKGWLRSMVKAFRNYPSASAVSGRTTYEGRTQLERLLALLSRSYLDPGQAGATRFVANNNACWRRDAFLAHPMPAGDGAFTSRIQSESVLRSGGELHFEPSAEVVHNFEGWPMEADIRRNIGFGTVVTRLRDSRLPYAGLVRLGRLAIPVIVAGKTLNSLGDCLRCWRPYAIRWYELPLALGLSAVVCWMEIPGMWEAYAGRQITGTAYR